MITRKKTLINGSIIVSVFFFSLLFTSPVFADDGATSPDSISVDSPQPSSEEVSTPPTSSGDDPTPPVEENSTTDPDEGAGDVPVNSRETPISGNDPADPLAAPVTSGSLENSGVVPGSTGTEPASSADNPLESIPEAGSLQSDLIAAMNESNLVLVNDQGEPVPLASNEAQVVSDALDPYFKSGADYIGYSTSGTCAAIVTICNTFVPAGTLISTAINAYGTTYSATATGAIFLEAGTYNENVIINSASTLTGLIGAGSNSNPLFGTVINGSISVQNTIKGFTLQGLNVGGNVVNGLITITGNTGALLINDVVVRNTNASGDGIVINNQTGNVTFNNVESSTNGDEGAKITNTGNVAITNSAFDRNNGPTSLQITTTGSLVLSGVSSSRNAGGNGAKLVAGKGITINHSHFETNTDSIPSNTLGYGIFIDIGTAGPISMNNVFANSNEESNIFLNYVNSTVNMTDIFANSSGNGSGVYIENCIYSVTSCSTTTVGNIVLTNIFSENNSISNLYLSSSGSISATNIHAQYVSENNATFDNKYSKTPQNISISNGYFDSGTVSGLVISTKGNVVLNHIESSNVQSSGIIINTTFGFGSVSILSTLGRNYLSSNLNYGLVVNSNGNILVDGIDANSNGWNGILLDNSTGTGSVTLKNAIANTNGTVTTDFGVFISSKGAITIVTLDSSYNDGSSAYLDNSLAPSPKPITLTNYSANNNDHDALVIFSSGIVSVTNASVYGNNVTTTTYGGLYINNLTGTGTVTVRLSTVNSNNIGLTINSRGAILLDNANASNNTNEGALINNINGTGNSNGVTIKNSTYGNNGKLGLDVKTKGLITIVSLIGNGNNISLVGTYGVLLDNTYGSGNIVISGTPLAYNHIESNLLGGLSIKTNGTIAVSFLTIIQNGRKGIEITDFGTGTVTISDLTSSSNVEEGLYVIAKGTITLKNPNIQNNQSSNAGAYLDNSSGTGGIVISGAKNLVGIFSNNHNVAYTLGKELDIQTTGAVTLSHLSVALSPENGLNISNNGAAGAVSLSYITSSYNGGTGIYIYSPGVGTVTLTSVDTENNGADGISISTGGAVTVNGSADTFNGSGGLDINNSGGLAKNVTISNVNTSSNSANGLNIVSKGIVTISGITSNNNLSAGYGIFVDNTSGTGGITLTSTGSIINAINNNTGYGVYLNSKGAVLIAKTSATSNSSHGVYVNNSSATSPITLNNVTSNYSTNLSGIQLINAGNVVLSGVTASFNNQLGANIQNTSGTGSVSITNSFFDNNANSNGIQVTSNGTITLTNVSAIDNNNGFGADLNNSTSVALTPAGINVQNSGKLMNLFNNDSAGLRVISKGAIKLVNITAVNTTYNAVEVDNTTGTAGVTVSNINTSTSSGFGIVVQSKGAVTGTTLVGDGGSTYAAIQINNCQFAVVCTGSGAVTLTNVTGKYSGTGLEVISNGNITINGLFADNNSNGYGAYLNNSNSIINGNVSVLKATISGNSLDGLRILSNGNTVIDGVSSTYNYSGGAQGVYVTGNGNVSILSTKGTNNFTDNSSHGLGIQVLGNIIINNVTADSNGGDGLNLISSGTGKTISLSTINVKENTESGIQLTSSSAAVFTAVKVFNNGRSANVDGIVAVTNGHNFTLSNSFVSGNGQNGIDAAVGGLTQTVKILKTLYFGNGQFGGSDVKDINTDGTLVFA